MDDEKSEPTEEAKTEESIQETSPKKPVIESDTEETEKVEKTEDVEEKKVESSVENEKKVEKVKRTTLYVQEVDHRKVDVCVIFVITGLKNFNFFFLVMWIFFPSRYVCNYCYGLQKEDLEKEEKARLAREEARRAREEERRRKQERERERERKM